MIDEQKNRGACRAAKWRSAICRHTWSDVCVGAFGSWQCSGRQSAWGLRVAGGRGARRAALHGPAACDDGGWHAYLARGSLTKIPPAHAHQHHPSDSFPPRPPPSPPQDTQCSPAERGTRDGRACWRSSLKSNMPRVVPPIDGKPSNTLSPSLVETVAGFSAGIVATLAVHPFDVLKTRLQCKRWSCHSAASRLRTADF